MESHKKSFVKNEYQLKHIFEDIIQNEQDLDGKALNMLVEISEGNEELNYQDYMSKMNTLLDVGNTITNNNEDDGLNFDNMDNNSFDYTKDNNNKKNNMNWRNELNSNNKQRPQQRQQPLQQGQRQQQQKIQQIQNQNNDIYDNKNENDQEYQISPPLNTKTSKTQSRKEKIKHRQSQDNTPLVQPDNPMVQQIIPQQNYQVPPQQQYQQQQQPGPPQNYQRPQQIQMHPMQQEKQSNKNVEPQDLNKRIQERSARPTKVKKSKKQSKKLNNDEQIPLSNNNSNNLRQKSNLNPLHKQLSRVQLLDQNEQDEMNKLDEVIQQETFETPGRETVAGAPQSVEKSIKEYKVLLKNRFKLKYGKNTSYHPFLSDALNLIDQTNLGDKVEDIQLDLQLQTDNSGGGCCIIL